MNTIDLETKIRSALEQIKREKAELNTLDGMALQIATVENSREISNLEKKISDWNHMLNETPAEKQERLESNRKETARLECLNNNFARLEENDWDY